MGNWIIWMLYPVLFQSGHQSSVDKKHANGFWYGWGGIQGVQKKCPTKKNPSLEIISIFALVTLKLEMGTSILRMLLGIVYTIVYGIL